MSSKEQAAFARLQHWRATTTLYTPQELLDQNSSLFILFQHLYAKTKHEYEKLPPRKNGTNAFIHPLNVTHYLGKAGIRDPLTICVSMVHDLIEEKVDQYIREKRITLTLQGRERVYGYEKKVMDEFHDDLLAFSNAHGLPAPTIREILSTLSLVTRSKNDYYYVYISSIFDHSDQKTRERALQVKLADRMHNVLTINCFDEQERIYQCFKSIFLLNNTKKLLLRQGITDINNPLLQLFKKCNKATYEAFLTICHYSIKKGIFETISLVQLAFKKFAFEQSGLGEVTALDPKEIHPTRLFHGVIRKYNAYLYHEDEKFKAIVKNEREYCKRFFAEYRFTDAQIQAILDYKDAYSLKEFLAALLYNPDYVLKGFLTSSLTNKGRLSDSITKHTTKKYADNFSRSVQLLL